ncbi:hypothetical protein [Pseudomonas defluvii]
MNVAISIDFIWGNNGVPKETHRLYTSHEVQYQRAGLTLLGG